LTLSPPINLDPKWLLSHAAYTASKYAMTLLTTGLAEQYRERGMVANCLWPATLIATAAVRNVVSDDDGLRRSRRPEVMADAAAVLLTRPAHEGSGQCYLDTEVLRQAGTTDLSVYAYDSAREEDLAPDLFL
jgi:citronellol/citronellal dehydrogenase